MSQSSSKQVMSGLRAIKRDFSSNSIPSSSQNSDRAEAVPDLAERSLAGRQLRLKLIQDALKGDTAPGERKAPAAEGSSSNTTGPKRSAPTDNQPPAKKRQLPSAWNENSSVASYSSTRALSASSNINSASKASITVTSSTDASAKPAGIFLSKEQTHILELVTGGESLFYTGSAGQ